MIQMIWNNADEMAFIEEEGVEKPFMEKNEDVEGMLRYSAS